MDLKNNILIPIFLVIILFAFTVIMSKIKDDKTQTKIDEYEMNISDLQNRNKELMQSVDSLELRVLSLYREKTQLHHRDSIRELLYLFSISKLKANTDSVRQLSVISKNEFILNYIYK